MKKLILLLLFVQSFSYSQDISLDDLLNIRSIPEYKLFAFENSFVLDKKSESKQSFYHKLSYFISQQNNKEYIDYQSALYLRLKKISNNDGVEIKRFLGFALVLNHWGEYGEYADENKIINEKLIKSIKNKCVVDQIMFWTNEKGHKYDKNQTSNGELSTGEIATVEYSCENKFGEKVIIERVIPRDSYDWLEFVFWNEYAPRLQRDSSFTFD